MEGTTTDEQLAQQYQPGTDLGDTLRGENSFLNAQNSPIIPAPQRQDVSAPNIGGWSERLADAANQIGVLPGVGGWARSLVASAVAALPKRPNTPAQSLPQPTTQPQPNRAQQIVGAIGSGIRGLEAGLGDAAAVGTVPAGGGALTGV